VKKIIKNATYIVTTSFHSVAFSIIYRKQFTCIVDKTKGMHRIGSLLEKLNLKDRMLLNSDELNVTNLPLPEIDYAQIERLLNAEREKSFEFLFNSIEGTGL
jgi:predicted ATP-binding protein involved in virulence